MEVSRDSFCCKCYFSSSSSATMAGAAPAVQGSLWSIDKAAKLSREANFVSWKSMVQPILKACGCWPFITGRRARLAFPPLAEGAPVIPDDQREPTADQDGFEGSACLCDSY